MANGFKLSADQIRYIKRHRLTQPASAMARAIGVSKSVVLRYLRVNSLRPPAEVVREFRIRSMTGRSQVSEYADFFIFCNYLDIPTKRIAHILGIGEGVAQRRVKRLGLNIPAEQRLQWKSLNMFKPGHILTNKGKKQLEYMSAEAIERTKGTRFQKGQIPPNKIHYRDGDITVRYRADRPNEKPHKYIRIRLRVWKELQIHNWEQINGPVPKDCILACKDGDTLNCDPFNWYLLSKADNAIRNSGSIHLSDGYVARAIIGKNGTPEQRDAIRENRELIQAKRTQLLLKRKIKMHEK